MIRTPNRRIHRSSNALAAIAALMLIAATAAGEAAEGDPPVCSDTEAGYAADAFRFYMTGLPELGITSYERFDRRLVFQDDSVIGECRLAGSGFAEMARIFVTFMSREEIHALAAASVGQRYYRVTSEQGLENGRIVITVSSWARGWQGGTTWVGGCDFEILVIDENEDGSPEEVRWPDTARNGVCA